MFRPEEMAIILEEAKRYTDSKGGYTAPGAVLSFNGNPNDYVVVDNQLVRISEKPYDINSIERITVNRNGEKVVYDKTELVVEQGIAIGLDDETFLLIVPNAEIADFIGLEIGVYLAYVEGIYYTEKVEFAETIHPIPQEYIPPLDRLILNGADGNQYALTITDGALSVAPVTT